MIFLSKNISRAPENFFIFRREAATRTEARVGGNSLPLQSLSFPFCPSGLGFCETPQAFRSKKVRAFSIIGRQYKTIRLFESHLMGGSAFNFPCEAAGLRFGSRAKRKGGLRPQNPAKNGIFCYVNNLFINLIF
jgi:hypothetical protein